jgi:pyridoxamine 5'-phosphate oxidase
MKSPEFVLGTLDNAPKGSPTPYVPRVRYCIFRGFWAELPENKHNDAERNPQIFASDCPTFTTDVRMEKVGQIFATSADSRQWWWRPGGSCLLDHRDRNAVAD